MPILGGGIDPGSQGVVIPPPSVLGGSASPPTSGATWSATNINGHVTLSADKLTATANTTAGNNYFSGLATRAITTGQKVRIEFKVLAVSSNTPGFGVGNTSTALYDGAYLGIDANSGAWYQDAKVSFDGFATHGTAWANNDIIDADVDFDAKTIEFFKNGVSVGVYTISITGDLYAAFTTFYDGTTQGSVLLVSPGSFTYAPPAGFTEYGA